MSFEIATLPANVYKYEISPTESAFINQDEDPCISSADRDKERVYQCLENYKASQLNCTLPWRYKKSANQLPLCSHEGEYDQYAYASFGSVEEQTGPDSDPESIKNVAKCMPTCTRYSYTTKLFQQEEHKELGDNLMLRFYYNQWEVLVRDHVYDYDELNLVADFGGWLGILLGYSLLGFYDTFEYVAVNLKRKLNTKSQLA